MDLFGPSRTTSLGGKSYAFVIINDFSRYTWALFLAHKRKIQNEKGFTIFCIRSDHKGNLKMLILKAFVMRMEFNINFQLLELPNKWGCSKEK